MKRAPVRDPDVLIVGAGILGLAAAYHLARAGARILVLERDQPNRGASGAGAGSIQLQIRRRQLSNPDRLATLGPMLAVQVAAARDWAGLEAELGVDLGVRLGGGLGLAETDADLRLLERKVALEQAAGLRSELLDAAAVHRLCPALADTVRGADHCLDEGFGNSLLLAPALQAAALRAGAEVRAGCAVRGLVPNGSKWRVATAAGPITAPRVVLAAGAWTGRLAASAGWPLPIGGYVMQVCATERLPQLLGPLLAHVSRPLTMKQAKAGNVLIGGSWPGTLFQDRALIRPESLRGSLWEAQAVVPELATAKVIRAWAGLNPAADGLPTIGECPGRRGLFVLQPEAGYSLGFTLAGLLAELVVGRRPRLPVEAFQPDRFDLAGSRHAVTPGTA